MRISLAVLPLLCPLVALASPVTLQHSGYLLGVNDQPLSTSADLRFRLFASEGATTPVWDTAAVCAVPVQSGYYRVSLGDDCGPALDGTLFSAGTAWLEVEVEGIALTPRARLDVVPAASEAAHALDADKLGGRTLAEILAADVSPEYVHSSGDETIGGTKTFSGSVVINDLLDVGGNVHFPASGRLGVGTVSPQESIETTGNVKAVAFYGSGEGLTNVPSTAVTGNFGDAQISSVDWSKITNAPPSGTGFVTLTAGEAITQGQAVRVSDGTNAETAGRAYRANAAVVSGSADFTDDFNRATGNTVGNGWSEVESVPSNFQVNSSVMLMQGSLGAATNTVMYRAISHQTALQARFTLRWDDGVGGTHRVSFVSGNTGTFDTGVGLRFNRDTASAATLSITDGATVKTSTSIAMADSIDYEVELRTSTDWSLEARVWAWNASRPATPTLSVGAFSPTSGGGSNFAIFRTQSSNTRNVVIDALVLSALTGAGSFIGLADSTVASGATVSVLYAGVATGLSGLSPGKRYYVGTTAGSLVATPPSEGTVRAGVALTPTSLLVLP